MLKDPTHLFRKMWDAEPWMQRHEWKPSCFQRKRDGFWVAQETHVFFQETKAGKHCDTNWYEGNNGPLGYQDSRPQFSDQAPALLGFDETIDQFCKDERKQWFDNKFYPQDHAGSCLNSNHNILSLYGKRVQYNLCRNLEWQVCAALGKLPGQGGFGMRFSYRPADLDVYGWKPLWQCHGFREPDAWERDPGCGDGYATDDIFFLEVCLLNQICANSEELFTLQVGDFFVCDFRNELMDELAAILTEEPMDRTEDTRTEEEKAG